MHIYSCTHRACDGRAMSSGGGGGGMRRRRHAAAAACGGPGRCTSQVQPCGTRVVKLAALRPTSRPAEPAHAPCTASAAQCAVHARARPRPPVMRGRPTQQPTANRTTQKAGRHSNPQQTERHKRPADRDLGGGGVCHATSRVGEQRKPSVVFGVVREVEAQNERAAHRAPARELSLALLERQPGGRVADGAIARVALRAELSAAAGLVASGVGPDHRRAKLEHVWVRPLEHTNTHHPPPARDACQQAAASAPPSQRLGPMRSRTGACVLTQPGLETLRKSAVSRRLETVDSGLGAMSIPVRNMLKGHPWSWSPGCGRWRPLPGTTTPYGT
jgi:hypothetical protein